MINIIASIPASLMPPPPPNPTETLRRAPARTNAYLLLPRAGAIMLSPVPPSACIEQAGPWRTAAVLEVREDGFLMEVIRSLARSGRGAAAASTILHPCLVNPAEYTEANTIASTHGDQATALYEEPVSLAAPMPRPGAPRPPPPINAWSNNRTNNTSPGQQQDAQDPTASPLSSHSSSASTQHTLDSQAQHPTGRTTDNNSPRNPRGHTPIPPATQTPTSSSEGGHGTDQTQPTWFSHLAYQLDSASSTSEGEGDEEAMDTTQPLPTNLSSTPPPQDPISPAPTQSIQELIEAAIKEAQRTAKEEYQKELATISLRHQQETQAIRAELQQGTQSLREDILTQAQQTVQLQQQQAAELQRIWEQRDRERTQAEAQRQAELLQQQEAA